MSSKRRIRRRKCDKKVRHHTAGGAWKVARRREGCAAYHCRFCRGWHVGHRPGSAMRQLKLTGILPAAL